MRESRDIQIETVALFIRKRIYMWLEQLIYPQPYIECRPNIVVKNVPKTVDVLDVVIQKLKRVKMGIVFHVGMKCFMKKCPTNPIIVQDVTKNLLWEQMGIVLRVGPNVSVAKKYLQSLMLMKSMN